MFNLHAGCTEPVLGVLEGKVRSKDVELLTCLVNRVGHGPSAGKAFGVGSLFLCLVLCRRVAAKLTLYLGKGGSEQRPCTNNGLGKGQTLAHRDEAAEFLEHLTISFVWQLSRLGTNKRRRRL